MYKMSKTNNKHCPDLSNFFSDVTFFTNPMRTDAVGACIFHSYEPMPGPGPGPQPYDIFIALHWFYC